MSELGYAAFQTRQGAPSQYWRGTIVCRPYVEIDLLCSLDYSCQAYVALRLLLDRIMGQSE